MKKLARLSMLLALAVVLSIVESIIPLFNGTIPGLKLGLANAIILLVLYTYGFKDTLNISLLRVFLVGILRTGVFSIAFWLSFGGAILSIIFMFVFKKVKIFSIIGISIIGSITHSIGQILVAMLILNNNSLLYYVPVLLIFAIPTGIFVG